METDREGLCREKGGEGQGEGGGEGEGEREQVSFPCCHGSHVHLSGVLAVRGRGSQPS